MDEPRGMRESGLIALPQPIEPRTGQANQAYIDIVLKGIAEQGLPSQWRAEVISSVEAIEG